MIPLKKKPTGCALALLIFFYPVGLCYLIYWLLGKDTVRDGHYRKRANHIAITAGVLIFTGIFFVIAALTGNVEVEDPSQIPFSIAVMLIVCCGGGLALLIPWWRFRQIAGLYELYAPVVIHDDVEDIRQIAAVTGREFPRTRQELEQLIAFGALDGRYIDYENDVLIWPNRPVVPQPKMIAKLCPHCSGQNQIPEGQTIRCAYCDSLIE